MKLNYQIKKKQSKKKTYVNIPSLWSITINHHELIERKVKKKNIITTSQSIKYSMIKLKKNQF